MPFRYGFLVVGDILVFGFIEISNMFHSIRSTPSGVSLYGFFYTFIEGIWHFRVKTITVSLASALLNHEAQRPRLDYH